MKSTLLSALLLATALSASAEITPTFSKNANTDAAAADTHVFTFSSLLAGGGSSASWGVESFTQNFVPSAPLTGDAANGKDGGHLAQAAGTGVLSSTLTLEKSESYFGIWWSTNATSNVLQFYEGSQLVGSYNSATVMGLLPDTYFGNGKDTAANGSGAYAFINFTGDSNTAWDKIVLTNNNYSTLGSDNATTRIVVMKPTTDVSTPTKVAEAATPAVATPVTAPAATDPLASWSSGTAPSTGSVLANSAVGAAPGAPAPPVTLLAAFAGVLVLRQVRARRQKAA